MKPKDLLDQIQKGKTIVDNNIVENQILSQWNLIAFCFLSWHVSKNLNTFQFFSTLSFNSFKITQTEALNNLK